MSNIRAEVRGAAATQAKLEQVAEDVHGKPMKQGMQQAVLWISADAKRFAPVDTGRLRSSITPQVTAVPNALRPTGVQGIVGSNVSYAGYMELGTGVFGTGRRHWPPAYALQQWARRHHMNAFVVARAIGLRGGLRPRRYLQRAFDKNNDRVVALIGNVVTQIVRK